MTIKKFSIKFSLRINKGQIFGIVGKSGSENQH